MKPLLLAMLLTMFFQLETAGQNDTAAADCYDAFFKSGTPAKSKGLIKLVLKNSRESSLSAFMKTNFIEKDARLALKDLDGDGKKELVIRNFTGGAHCCDEFYFCAPAEAANKYAFAARLFAGNTCVDANNNFTYNLHESFGYFFTCFACGLDGGDEAGKKSPIQYVQDITLNYKGGKLEVQPGSSTTKEKIKSNLAYIKKLGWDSGVKEADFDDGRRKELAINLAVYYFSFGRNLPETKALFAAYYAFKDAAKVWTQFVQNLDNIKKNNGF